MTNRFNAIPSKKGVTLRGVITTLRLGRYGWYLKVTDLSKKKKAEDPPKKRPRFVDIHTGPVRCKH